MSTCRRPDRDRFTERAILGEIMGRYAVTRGLAAPQMDLVEDLPPDFGARPPSV
jgi:hypothetical protein